MLHRNSFPVSLVRDRGLQNCDLVTNHPCIVSGNIQSADGNIVSQGLLTGLAENPNAESMRVLRTPYSSEGWLSRPHQAVAN